MSGRINRAIGGGLTVVLSLMFLAAAALEIKDRGLGFITAGLVAGGVLIGFLWGGSDARAMMRSLRTGGQDELDEGEAASSLRLEDVEARLNEVSMELQRLGELEERLDFAERLLAQQQERSPLPPAGEG